MRTVTVKSSRPKLTMRLHGKTWKTKYAIALEKIAWYNKNHPTNREQILMRALRLQLGTVAHCNPVLVASMYLPYYKLPPLLQNAVSQWIVRKGKTYTMREE